MSIDYEKVLKEKLHEDAFAFITSSEKEFADWVERVRWQAKRCDELAWELKRLKDKEEQGLLIELPVRIGEVVYSAECGEVVADFLYSVTKDKSGLWAVNQYGGIIGRFGKTVFSTRSEAEEALAKMGGK